MRIAVVSKLWEKTDPFSTGGTGMSVGTLINGLVEDGHQVTLFATADSKSRAQKLISFQKKPYQNDYSEIKEYQNIAQAFKQAKDFDIINTHIEHKACFFAPLTKTPTLITLRYGEFFADELNLLRQNRLLNYSFNSTSLQKKFSFLNSLGVVYNGLDLNNYPFVHESQNYLLFLGRVSPQKGTALAIQAALKSNYKLIIAGKIVKSDQDYFKKQILPYLDNKRITYQGEVNFKKKIQLLSQALALIQPTQFFEACSNVILEAQACGTPVITFNKGANKELVKDGQTGFITTPRSLTKAIKSIHQIKRQDCHDWIGKNFNYKDMVAGYEKIYQKLIKNK
jgi:glycosyltransferase involved in cell wall biosynthesis